MATYYSLSDLKLLAVDSANTYGVGVTYATADGDKAYDYAVARCGFENPGAADVDFALRQLWLLESMHLYFLHDVQRRYALKFDVSDLKLSQPSRILRDMVADKEAAFEKAKASVSTAHLFVDTSTFFGEMVIKSGIVDDAIGQSVDEEEL